MRLAGRACARCIEYALLCVRLLCAASRPTACWQTCTHTGRHARPHTLPCVSIHLSPNTQHRPREGRNSLVCQHIPQRPAHGEPGDPCILQPHAVGAHGLAHLVHEPTGRQGRAGASAHVCGQRAKPNPSADWTRRTGVFGLSGPPSLHLARRSWAAACICNAALTSNAALRPWHHADCTLAQPRQAPTRRQRFGKALPEGRCLST